MKQLGFGILLFATACGQAPDTDPRHADVVVESAGLDAAAVQATSWWYGATGAEVAFSVVGGCAPGRVCARIHLGALAPTDAGMTEYPVGHPEEPDTTVAEGLDPDLLAITIAHELGHVLGLAHDDGLMTAVMNDATWKLPSEWGRR